MSNRDWTSTNAGRAVVALLATATVLTLWTLVNAIRIAPVPESSEVQFAGGSALAATTPARNVDVAAAVETDPFAADRSAPEHAYRAPGEEGDGEPKVAAPEPVVLGTAVSDAARSFATVQLGDGHATIMRVGGRIGEYTIKSIERGHVVFTTPSGKKLDIQELKP